MSIERQLAALGATPAMIAGTLVDGKPLADFDERPGGVVVGRVHREPGRIAITIPGPSPGKPRQTRRDVWKKRPAVVRYRDWCDLVRSIAGEVPAAVTVERVRLDAHFEPPKSWSKKRRCAAIGTIHRSKPDGDNIMKAAFDTLWPKNDSAIGHATIRKLWGWRAMLEIEIILVEATK